MSIVGLKTWSKRRVIKRNISKRLFLTTLTCNTLGWIEHHQEYSEQQAPSLGDRFRMEEGIEVGERARLLFPGGLLIEERKMSAAAGRTKRAIEEGTASVIFEGAFLVDGMAARADILRRSAAGWDLMEVKSALNEKEGFVDDMAYTAMVLARSGLAITSVSLLLLSKDYRLGLPDEALFVAYDSSAEVLQRAEAFAHYWDTIKKVMERTDPPEPRLELVCKQCAIFRDCLGKGIDHHILDLPKLSKTKFEQLKGSKILSIEEIPEDFPLTANQVMAREAVLKKSPTVRAGLKSALGRVKWPAFYLDFEAVGTAIPLYPETRPHTQVLTQYSAHLCAGLDEVIDHFEYLADPKRDCREALAGRLIADLEGEGSIIVYSPFERTMIKDLAKRFPHLAKDLKALAARIVDLHAILSKNFYHPDFQGKTRIKKILPVLVPEMSYDGLEVPDGASAIAAFAKLAKKKYKEKEAEKIKKALKEYCKQDTQAMVKLHNKLVEFCG